MAHRVWATGEPGSGEPGTIYVDASGQDYMELDIGVQTVLTPGGTVPVHYAEGNGSIPEVGPNAPALPSVGIPFQGVQYVTLKSDSGSQPVVVSLPSDPV